MSGQDDFETIDRAELGAAHGGGLFWKAGPKNVIPKVVLSVADNFIHMGNHMRNNRDIVGRVLPAIFDKIENATVAEIPALIEKARAATTDAFRHQDRAIYRKDN